MESNIDNLLQLQTTQMEELNTIGYIILQNVISITENDIDIIEEQINTNKVYIFNQDCTTKIEICFHSPIC
jgi:hypothetical protein